MLAEMLGSFLSMSDISSSNSIDRPEPAEFFKP